MGGSGKQIEALDGANRVARIDQDAQVARERRHVARHVDQPRRPARRHPRTGIARQPAARWIDEGTWHLPPAPQFPFTDDELDEKVQLEVQLHTYVDEQMTRFIDGQNDMSGDWEAFIDRIKQLSAGRLEEIYNTAMNGYLEAAGITLN